MHNWNWKSSNKCFVGHINVSHCACTQNQGTLNKADDGSQIKLYVSGLWIQSQEKEENMGNKMKKNWKKTYNIIDGLKWKSGIPRWDKGKMWGKGREGKEKEIGELGIVNCALIAPTNSSD